jgi:hypothetical protein
MPLRLERGRQLARLPLGPLEPLVRRHRERAGPSAPQQALPDRESCADIPLFRVSAQRNKHHREYEDCDASQASLGALIGPG